MNKGSKVLALVSAVVVMQLLGLWMQHCHHKESLRQMQVMLEKLPACIADGKTEIDRREREAAAWLERENAKLRAALPYTVPGLTR